MSIVDDLINDLINQHEILPDAFLVKNTAKVAEDFHHSVQDIHDIGGLDIVLGCCHKVYSKFLSVEVIYTIHVEAWGRVTLPELNFSKEYLTGLSAEVKADYNSCFKNVNYNLL